MWQTLWKTYWVNYIQYLDGSCFILELPHQSRESAQKISKTAAEFGIRTLYRIKVTMKEPA